MQVCGPKRLSADCGGQVAALSTIRVSLQWRCLPAHLAWPESDYQVGRRSNCMVDTESRIFEKRIRLEGTDIEVCVRLENKAIRIDVKKSDFCVHTVVIDDAAEPLEHGWLVNLLAREDHVELRDLAKDADEYLISTNTNQG